MTGLSGMREDMDEPLMPRNTHPSPCNRLIISALFMVCIIHTASSSVS